MSRPFMIIYLFIWLVFSLNVFAIPSSSSSDSSLFVDDKLNNQLLSVSLQLEDPLPFELEPSSDIFLEDESTPGYFPTGIELDLNAPVDENQLGLSDILNEANHPNLEPQFSLNEPNLNGKQILDGGTTEIALNDCSSPSPPFSRTRKRANQCPDPSNPSFSLELPTLESIAEEQSKRKWCWRTAVPGFGNVPICHQPGTLVTRMESMMNPPTNPVGEMGFLYVGYGHLNPDISESTDMFGNWVTAPCPRHHVYCCNAFLPTPLYPESIPNPLSLVWGVGYWCLNGSPPQ